MCLSVVISGIVLTNIWQSFKLVESFLYLSCTCGQRVSFAVQIQGFSSLRGDEKKLSWGVVDP